MVNSRGENSDSIPIDLISEIFSRLPAKSVARSSARPRLLFALNQDHEWSFFSSPQPQNPDEKSSLVVAAGFRVKIHGHSWTEFWGYAFVHLICNPSTGQCASLPKLRTYGRSHSFLGFDPIDKQFKVLFNAYDNHRILTFGIGKLSWRNIQCPIPITIGYSKGMCINGYDSADRNGTLKLRLRVLEDVEKQKWSKYVYTLSDDKFVDLRRVTIAGVTATGEIVLSMRYASKPFYVLYFNPERSTHQSVEIQGFGEYYDENCSVKVFVDHVEDLNFYKIES
ncbi:hypothetical protein EUTSA_v10009370mg [Eutrema salsugineum]|uniref:F-box associated beta-propeller type 3 domain-containing protein n=1 Tax=Eutrema salsugineum TaxID=72664 RepID=V4MPZ3_EUTSA|nr:hypothetical protein EUTSA_v10009370mg [Eutrema salsugineum]